MLNRELIVDYLPFSVSREQINESLNKNNGKLIVSGILQRANSKNQNGRVYPKSTLMREAKKYLNAQIKESRALGELDHPDSSVVNLNNVSHNVLEMHWNNDTLLGTLEVLPTPSGNILKELFKAGIKLGISSRGLGSVKEITEDGVMDPNENPTVEVQSDFELIAFDFVSSPSTQGAFMSQLKESANESKTRICGKWCEVETVINNIMIG